MYEEENEKEGLGARRTALAIKSIGKKQLKSPLIFGQILFLQVSTQTSRARPEASRNSRRSEVRAKNLRGENGKWNKHMRRQNFSNPGKSSRTHDTTMPPLPRATFCRLLLVTAREVRAICCVYVTAITRKQ